MGGDFSARSVVAVFCWCMPGAHGVRKAVLLALVFDAGAFGVEKLAAGKRLRFLAQS